MNRTHRILRWLGWSVFSALILVVGAAMVVFPDLFSRPTIGGGPPTMRLISAEQYRNTIQYVVGNDIQIEASFPVPQRRDGLVTLGGTKAEMTPGDLDQFDRAARSIAAEAVDASHRDTLVACTPHNLGEPDDACAKNFYS